MSARRYDAVVVGSGFGGAISALRLAEAGKDVLVLERGRDYRDRQFPRDVTDVDTLFWREPEGASSPRRGLYDVRFFSGIGVVAASGLGGGSLLYANIHIRPDAEVFDDPRWPRTITRASLEPYFDRVATILHLAPPPATLRLPKRDVFRQAAARLGREVFEPDMAVAWDESPGPGREPCQLVADCEFGCRHGAKQSLDVTYLAGAAALGAELRTNTIVTHVEPERDGYRVHVQGADGAAGSVAARRVVLSAGTLGTNELLFRSRDVARTLPKVSATLGHGFSGNGDFLGSIQNSATDLEPWVGPDVTSVMRFADQSPRFTVAAPTFNRSVMGVLASLGQPRVGWLRPASPLLWSNMERALPALFARGALSKPSGFRARNAGDPSRMTNLFAIGCDNANGRLQLRRGRLDIAWHYARENRALVKRMTRAMADIAAAYGGTFETLATWQICQRTITVHPLGGCRPGSTPQEGVVTPDGEVHGYPGLFVADGSVIPTALGVHPCMTIAAIAERTADAAVESFAGRGGPTRAQVPTP